MAAISDPNMGLFFGFGLGETPWNVEMDSNIQILGAMAMLSVRSRSLTAPPGSPSNGDIYYVPLGSTGVWAANLQSIAVFSDLQFSLDAIGWLYVPVKIGWQFRVENEVGVDGEMLSVYYDGGALKESVNLTNFVQKDESYTATGVIDFTNTITRSSVEIATVDDITNAISGQDFSDFVHITGTETITGSKTFAATVSGIEGVAANDFVTLSQMQDEVGLVSGVGLGGFVDVFKNKTGNALNFRSLQSSDASITIIQNVDDIDFNVNFPASGATTFLDLTDVDPTTYSGQSGQVVAVNGSESGLEFIDPGASLEVLSEGNSVGIVGKINFIGADVNAFLNGDTIDIYIPSVVLAGTASVAPSTAIRGEIITDITLSWSYVPSPVVLSSQVITGSSIGNVPVLTTDRTVDISSLLIFEDETFTFLANSSFGESEFTAELTFINHIYYGKSATNEISTGTEITNLSDVVDNADFTVPTYSFDSTDQAEYLYICWPVSLGLSSRWNNLNSPFDVVTDSNVSVINVTNAEGHPEDYYATHSVNALAGEFDIQVL